VNWPDDVQARKAIREEVIGRFDSWATGEIRRLERRARKAVDRGYPALADAYNLRAKYVQAIIDEIKRGLKV
jgi:hypothetical protein